MRLSHVWARHHQDRLWHRVTSVQPGGSVATACMGRWSVRDAYVTTEDYLIPFVMCEACRVPVAGVEYPSAHELGSEE